MGNIIFSAFADEYNPSFDKQIEVLKNIGWKYNEVRFVDGENISDISKEKVQDIAKKLKDNGISVSSVGSPLGKINLADDFYAHIEKAKRVFEYANILGTDKIRMFSFYLPNGAKREDCKCEVLDRLEKLLTLADSCGLTLCHENEADIYGESPENCFELLTAFDGRLKCVFDMGNFVLGGYEPYAAYLKLKPYIEYFHIKDARFDGAIVPPGKGEGRIKEILSDFTVDKAVIATLEPHLQVFNGLNALTEHSFKNPYEYSSSEEAFLDASEKIMCLVGEHI